MLTSMTPALLLYRPLTRSSSKPSMTSRRSPVLSQPKLQTRQSDRVVEALQTGRKISRPHRALPRTGTGQPTIRRTLLRMAKPTRTSPRTTMKTRLPHSLVQREVIRLAPAVGSRIKASRSRRNQRSRPPRPPLSSNRLQSGGSRRSLLHHLHQSHHNPLRVFRSA